MKDKISRLFRTGLVAGVMMAAFAANVWGVQVENVRGEQREGSNKVDIWYDLPSSKGCTYEIELKFEGKKTTPPADTLSGDFGTGVTPGKNKHIVWNAGKDFPKSEDDIKAVITATEETYAGMVRIPGGTNSGQLRWSSGTYSLTVDTFWMDKTEVTYSHWKKVYDWAVKHGYSFSYLGSGKAPNHPVHTITGYDALKWCNARSEMEGKKCVYLMSDGTPMRTGTSWSQANLSCGGYRLPTRDEWQYAARGGLQSKLFPWGDTISHAQANYYAYPNYTYYDYVSGKYITFDMSSTSYYHPSFNDGVYPYTSPVGSFAPNGYGLYDMAGNVWEFTTTASGLGRDYASGGGWGNGGCIIVGGWGSGWNAYYDSGFRCARR